MALAMAKRGRERGLSAERGVRSTARGGVLGQWQTATRGSGGLPISVPADPKEIYPLYFSSHSSG